MPKLIKPTIIFFAFIVIFIYVSSLFQIKTVNINSQDCLKSEDTNLAGKFIFTIQENSLEKDLTQKFPCISTVKISKMFPSKIVIDVETKKPSAQVADTDFEITQSGQIIKGKDENLPQLYLPGEIKIQENQIVTDKKTLTAAKIAALIAKTDFHPATIRLLPDDGIALYQTDQTVAIFSSEKSADEQVDSLQQTLAIAKIDGTKLAKIDLRFRQPVISFK